MRFALAGLLLLACSKDQAPRTHQVAIRGMEFVPATVEVAVGDTIVWTNEDIVPHTVTSTAPPTFDSAGIESKKQWQHTVTVTGDFPYVCTFHPTMHGTIIAR
jgi:plastocyanin